MPAFNQVCRRSAAVLVSILLATVSLIVMVPPTGAEAATELPNTTPVMVDNPATGVTADALPTTQINGVAWDQVVVGNTVYVGGNFSTARPAGSAAGSNEVSRTHLMSYNLSTGVMTSWAPLLNGQVRVLAVSPDKTKLYVGGSFTKVNNVTRNRVAAFNISDGSLVSDFAPNVGYTVQGLAVSNSAVYIGGAFQAINSVSRSYLGAVDLSGNLTAWAPTADFAVSSVALTPAQDRVVVSGGFSKINDTSAPSIASVDATSGALYSFAANTVVNNSAVNPPTIAGINPGAGITSLKMANGSVYATAFSWYMGNFEGVLKADPYTGTIQNLVECRGDTLDAVPMNGIIYSVSHHHRCEQVGGFPEQTPQHHQFADAVTDEATGRLQAYFPGQPAGSYVGWFPDFNTGTASGANQSGWTAETAGDYLLIGGEFTRVSGSAQQGLVRFGTRNVVSKPSVALGGFGSDMGLSLKNVSTTSTRLSFKALFDRDGGTLDYRIFRTDKGTTTPLTTLTAKSTFWNRPQLSWTDTSVVAGTSYTYYVVAIDPDGNFRTAPRVTIVAGEGAPVASDYSNQVLADGATNYWRMNDPVGSTSITDWGAGSDLALPGSGVTLAREGAVIGSTDTAASFSGSANVSAGTTSSMAGPNTFSQELWFKTTTTSGGKLLGFGSASSGNSGSYDRHIYMSADGRLNFGVYPGTSKVVSSAKSFNDGKWHYVVSSLSSDGMVLWVDGMKVGEDTSVTYGQDYTGYWRVGGDSSWSGANYFNGTIDDVAIYSTPLSRTQIRDHYTKSGRTLNLPALPTDPYGKAVTDDDPTLFWRLGETGDTTAVDANGGGIDGTYYNGVVQGVPSDVVDGDPAAQFDGSNDLVSSNTNFNNPTVYSIEAWFKTTSTRGGKIVGFGRAQTGNSSSYDRHVYMSADGRLNFGAYSGNSNVATSTATYNDGTWHYVVATMGANGQMLYVDGALVANNPNTQSENYIGFWRVGGDNSWSGDPYFNGTIDEVAVYSKVLKADRVLAHYRSSGVWQNVAPTASFTMAKNGLSIALDASTSSDSDGSIHSYEWDFGDGTTGTGATPDHTYADAGTYTVSLKVTDDLNLSNSTSKTTTVRAGGTATDEYGEAVTEDNPLLYWRLDEVGGSTAKDLTAHAYDGTASGASMGAGSTVTSVGRSASFSGDQFIASDDSFDNPTTFSVEAWFKTADTGQRIIGFGSEKSGRSNNYDRHVYLDETGRLVFGTYSDGFHSVATAGSYNDNKWHYVVGTLGASGMALYVDGALQGSDAATVAQDYSGYWRVGADNQWSGSGNFNGQIDEAAVYGSVLSADRVAAHYAASLASNIAPVADFATNCTVASCVLTASANDPDGTIASYDWDLGDGSVHATTAEVTHLYQGAGTYHVVLTVTDNRGTSTTVAKDVVVVVPNQAPTAIIDDKVVTDLAVSVNGGNSTDSDGTIVSYTWDFGDLTPAQTGPTASHIYALPGTYTVSLTVVDDDGAVNTATTPVTVALPNTAPTAVIKPVIPDGLAVSVDGSDSYDADADGGIASYAWTFGDGAVGSGPTASHMYTGGGTYTITLTVTDNRGATASATEQVTVTAPNQAPTAVIGTPSIDGLKVSLSGSGSSDPEHTTLTYEWHFGDGQTATGVAVEHTYVTEGSYTITLVVTDAGGASNSVTTSVNVVKPNQKPVAVIGTPLVDHLNIQVDGTASHDDDGSVTSYAWTFGDGGTATTAVAGHAYETAGTYTVKLVVTDNLGQASEAATTTVTVTAGNQAPVAKIKPPVIDGLKVVVDGSDSTDDGSIASYSWNFGEGAPQTTATATHIYSTGGTYTITLTVTDNLGVTSTDTVVVTVTQSNAKPTAVIKDPIVDLNSVRVDGSDSTDSDGSVVSYAWDFGDGNTATGASADHAYTAGGTYTVKLTVTDNLGATDSATKSITVSAPPATTIAEDAFNRTASRWGTADIGGAWADSGASYFSTDGSMGQVRIAAATTGPTAYLRSVSARDVTVITDFALAVRPAGGTYYHSLMARVSGTTFYQLTVRTNAAGNLYAELSRSLSGTSTSLKTVTLGAYSSGERLKVRFDVSGDGTTDLAGKVWKVDQNEPSAANITATDSTAALQAAGQVGLKFYLGAGVTTLPTLVSVDNYQVVPYTEGNLENQPPVAKFDATVTSWKLHLDASDSTDDGSIAGYAWDFGDGTASGSGKVVDHTYAADGVYNVKLTVTDNRGVTSTLTKSVTVHNQAPIASFTATPKEWTAEFNASASSDDGTVESYAWEFGDGTVGTGKEPSHTYGADGTYQVKLTVTDDLGVTTSVTKPVTVVNAAPVAAFSTRTDALKLEVDASAATDDLAITSYDWDFGDGTGTGKTASHTYAAAGTYTVTLTVTDGRGLTGTKSESVTVTVNANSAPIAAFTATPVDLKVTVDGTSSNDPDGSIESYAWDFGDGGSSTQVSTSHTYAAAGTYSVKLTVTDNKGKTDSITKSVTVTAPAVTVVASDSFERSTTDGWGSADKGGTWTVTNPSQFSTNGTSGVVTIPSAGTGPTARLASVSARDVTVRSDFKLDRAPTGSTYYHFLYARMAGSRNYSVQARVSPSGALALDLVRTVSGTSTVLKSATVAGVKYAAGDQINLRFDVTGTGTTTLAARAWRDGDAEPAVQVTTTDTTAELQNAGATGIKMYAGAALTSIPLQITVDSFKVESA